MYVCVCVRAHTTGTITQPQKSTTEMMKLCHWSPEGWTLEIHTLSEISQMHKTADDEPLRQNKKKEREKEN